MGNYRINTGLRAAVLAAGAAVALSACGQATGDDAASPSAADASHASSLAETSASTAAATSTAAAPSAETTSTGVTTGGQRHGARPQPLRNVTIDRGEHHGEDGFTVRYGRDGADATPITPDTHEGYQKELRDALKNAEDPAFFNPRTMDTAEKTVYSLLDTCESGDAGAACRERSACELGEGQRGTLLDVAAGGAGEPDRGPRGTRVCVQVSGS